MPRLSPESEAFGWASGVINAGVQQKADTATLWQAIRTEAERLGVTDLSGGFRAVTELRSIYVQQRQAAESFGRSGDSELFTRQLAPEDVNARDLADQGLFPEYLVRFDLETVDDLGEVNVRTVTMRDTWLPDMTVGQVRDAVAQSAAGLSNDYGVTLSGFSNLRPVSI